MVNCCWICMLVTIFLFLVSTLLLQTLFLFLSGGKKGLTSNGHVGNCCRTLVACYNILGIAHLFFLSLWIAHSLRFLRVYLTCSSYLLSISTWVLLVPHKVYHWIFFAGAGDSNKFVIVKFWYCIFFHIAQAGWLYWSSNLIFVHAHMKGGIPHVDPLLWEFTWLVY